MPEVGALALDDVEHAMGQALPARQMDGQRRAGEFRGAGGAAQDLLLGRREVLADADLADDAGADLGLVVGDAAVGGDRLGDRLDRHRLHIVRDATASR